MSFRQRSYQKELLDRDDIPFNDIRKNMQELDFINQHLGGHKITIAGLKKFIPNTPKEYHIAEIGCGGGNNLRVIKRWCNKKGINVQLTGIDINKECIQFAEQQAENKGMHFICSDYEKVTFANTPTIIFSSLFCHHFKDDELVSMMRWMNENSKAGFFINDLHRHPLAYYSIKLLTKAFSKSYLVKNDAPLSVQRGFIKKDWERIFSKALITNFDIEWKWAFRWLISYHK